LHDFIRRGLYAPGEFCFDAIMNPPKYLARRATLDDMDALRPLWAAEQLPEQEMQKRAADFQVAHTPEGIIVGAVGLQVDGLQGHIYGEAFGDFGLADILRPVLWERVQTVSRNRGLLRLWTRENALFWRERGFDPAGPAQLEKFSARFGAADPNWLTLKLKDELFANLTPEQEFALFKDAAKSETDRALKQARVLKWIATLIALVFLGVVSVAGFYLIRYLDRRKQRDGAGFPPGKR